MTPTGSVDLLGLVARGCRTLGSNPWMALLVYLDAGGNARTPTLSAAGFIAREEQWLSFDRDWRAILDDAGVSALHMKDFAHSTGEFKSWKGDEERRREFLSRLSVVIKNNTLKHVSTTLLVETYDAFNAQATVRERLGRPYTLTMLSALVLVRHWRDDNCPSEPMAIFVEHGDEDQGELIDVTKRVGYPYPVTPLRKKSETATGPVYVQPFQAADFLAYEYHKNVKSMLERYGRDAFTTQESLEIKSRKSFHSLFAGFGPDDYQRVIGLHGLAELARVFGVRRRATIT